MANLLTSLYDNTSFKKLVLKNNNLSGKQLFMIQKFLKQNTGLTLLDL